MFANRKIDAGVCAGNWDRKEKRKMGFIIPHRTLAGNLMKGMVKGINKDDGATRSATKEAAKMADMANDAMI